VAPNHEHDKKQKRHNAEKRLHPVNPTDAHRRNPIVDVEINGQAQEQPHAVEHQRSLYRVRAEAFANVVYRNGDTHQRPYRDEKLAERINEPV